MNAFHLARRPPISSRATGSILIRRFRISVADGIQPQYCASGLTRTDKSRFLGFRFFRFKKTKIWKSPKCRFFRFLKFHIF